MLSALRISLFSLLFLASTSFAALNLELTQGISGAIPIAMVAFAGQTQDPAAADNISAVVTSDLQNSGRFTVKQSTSASQQPQSAADVDFKYWQKQNVNDMVVGKVTPQASGEYQVNFQLINVFASQASKSQSGPKWLNSVLLNKTFTVKKSQLRNLAHHISDLIYQSLTGDKGIFSTRIAYVLVERNIDQPPKYFLEISDVDGYKPQTLLTSQQPIMSPNWSPNGKQVAYVSFETGRPAIYIQNVATGQRKRVTDFNGINSTPAWSPNGKELALVLTKSGYPKIYTYDIASRKLTQVTQGWSADTEPRFSPNGQSIYFSSNRGSGLQIYEVTLASKQVQRVTFNGTYNATANVGPNDQELVYLHRQNGQYNIAKQDLQNGRMTLLTQTGNDQSPSLAPNGKMVVFATRFAGRGILSMVSTDGRVKLRLPARNGDVREPAWSPFLS